MEAYQNNILYRYDPSKEEEYMQMDFNYFDGVKVTGKTRWGYDQVIVEQDIYILNGEEHFEKGYRSEEPQTYEKWISGVGQSKYYFQDAGWPYGTARSTLIDWDVSNIMDATGTQTNVFLYLFQNFPNPFNPKTKITYSIAKDSNVNLTVYDILGNKVTTLIDDFREAGLYDVIFNAQNLPSGVYIYRVKAGGFSESKKMILLK